MFWVKHSSSKQPRKRNKGYCGGCDPYFSIRPLKSFLGSFGDQNSELEWFPIYNGGFRQWFYN